MDANTLIIISGQLITVVSIVLTRSDKTERRIKEAFDEIKVTIQKLFDKLDGKVETAACNKAHDRIERDINNIADIARGLKP